MRTHQPLKALTLHQPWAWAVAVGLKPIENRSWAPRGQLEPGDRLAIHAGLALEPRKGAFDLATVRQLAVMAGRGAEVPKTLDDPQLVRGAVVAVATYAGIIEGFNHGAELDEVLGSFGLKPEAGEWYLNTCGWVLRDVKQLAQPIGCRGFQGLWQLDGETLFQVVEQLEGRAA